MFEDQIVETKGYAETKDYIKLSSKSNKAKLFKRFGINL